MKCSIIQNFDVIECADLRINDMLGPHRLGIGKVIGRRLPGPQGACVESSLPQVEPRKIRSTSLMPSNKGFNSKVSTQYNNKTQVYSELNPIVILAQHRHIDFAGCISIPTTAEPQKAGEAPAFLCTASNKIQGRETWHDRP